MLDFVILLVYKMLSVLLDNVFIDMINYMNDFFSCLVDIVFEKLLDAFLFENLIDLVTTKKI